jgi:hypothetical protein
LLNLFPILTIIKQYNIGYNVELQPFPTFPTYCISPAPLQEICLRSGKVLNQNSSVIIQENEEEELPTQPEINTNKKSPLQTQNQSCSSLKSNIQEVQTPQSNQPPFPERLQIEKSITPLEFDFVAELKNICVKIPLLQALKDIPIYTKTIRDLCIKKPRKTKKRATHYTSHRKIG